MKKILIVEDDQFQRELYAEILESEGFKIKAVADGEKGYQEMEKGGYDLVLLDAMLPKIDGFEILKKLKKEKKLGKNKSIFLLTNLNQEILSKKMGSIKVDQCLIKSSLDPDELIKKVKKILG